MSALSDLFQNIADAIRTKTGDTATMAPATFPDHILAIPTGGSGDGEVNSDIVIATDWTTSSNRGSIRTVTHGLGVVPDIIYICWTALGKTPTSQILFQAVGFSQAFAQAHGIEGQYMVYNGSNGAFVGVSSEILVDASSNYCIYGATETQFTFGSTNYPLDTSQNYRWLAIGGLT